MKRSTAAIFTWIWHSMTASGLDLFPAKTQQWNVKDVWGCPKEDCKTSSSCWHLSPFRNSSIWVRDEYNGIAAVQPENCRCTASLSSDPQHMVMLYCYEFPVMHSVLHIRRLHGDHGPLNINGSSVEVVKSTWCSPGGQPLPVPQYQLHN